MAYDFDTVPERKNTNCLKYDAALKRKGRDDLLPLWVADMDFKLPEEVLADLHKAVDHGIFGYSFPGDEFYEAVRSWYARRFNWQTKREWMIQTPGVVFALGVAIQAYSEPGDGVLIQQPVYYPFAHIIKNNDRVLVNNELVYARGSYHINLDDFEKQIVDNKVKVFILCNPHNPVGRVWTKEELLHMGAICKKHGVIVVSDEIHSDFVYPGHTHHVFDTLDESFREFSIICTAPSKTFNLAGLQIANIFIADGSLRRKYWSVLKKLGYDGVNTMALIANQAVYTKGEPWLKEMQTYLQGNLDFTREYLKEHLPQIKLIEPEGTYLVWLDCSALGFTGDGLDDFMIDKAHLWLDAGTLFGENSDQFERINLACPRSIVKQCLDQLKQAVEDFSRIHMK